MSAEIVVLPSARAVAEALADRTAAALRATLAGEPRATLCLTGGSTPVPAYERLAEAEGVDWDRVHVFWSDERCVAADHPESNAGMAYRTLLEPAGVPESNIHKMPGSCPPDEGSQIYEQALEQFFGDTMSFDVLHLGMGDDGHTASLFPGTQALNERERRVAIGQAPPGASIRDRLTLTFSALATAKLCLIAATGAHKRDAFSAALDAYDNLPPERPGGEQTGPPIAQVSATSALIWLVDRDLAQGLADQG